MMQEEEVTAVTGINVSGTCVPMQGRREKKAFKVGIGVKVKAEVMRRASRAS